MNPTGCACLMIKSSEKRTRLTFLAHDAMLACWGHQGVLVESARLKQQASKNSQGSGPPGVRPWWK